MQIPKPCTVAEVGWVRKHAHAHAPVATPVAWNVFQFRQQFESLLCRYVERIVTFAFTTAPLKYNLTYLLKNCVRRKSVDDGWCRRVMGCPPTTPVHACKSLLRFRRVNILIAPKHAIVGRQAAWLSMCRGARVVGPSWSSCESELVIYRPGRHNEHR